jgi:hypothetical protein
MNLLAGNFLHINFSIVFYTVYYPWWEPVNKCGNMLANISATYLSFSESRTAQLPSIITSGYIHKVGKFLQHCFGLKQKDIRVIRKFHQ